MAKDSNATRVPLDRTTFLRLTGAAGTIVVCVSGCLWITRDGSPEDTLLEAGQRYEVKDSTRVIATAFEPSVADVSKPVKRARVVERDADTGRPALQPGACRLACSMGE
jgi:hypothetical protein